jgi:hypothetical protein
VVRKALAHLRSCDIDTAAFEAKHAANLRAAAGVTAALVDNAAAAGLVRQLATVLDGQRAQLQGAATSLAEDGSAVLPAEVLGLL